MSLKCTFICYYLQNCTFSAYITIWVSDLMISPTQIRAARAMLDWSQDKLAEVTGLAKRTILTLEQGNTVPRADTANAIQDAFEKNGIEFLPGNGVRQKEEIITVYEGDEAEEQLLNDVYETMLREGRDSEILIYGLDETDPKENPQAYALAKAQLERLSKAGIKERIIGREGNTNFVAPWHYYRWVPKEINFKTPLFIYGSKIALNNEKPPYKSIVIENDLFAETCRSLFNFAWDRAVVPSAPKDL